MASADPDYQPVFQKNKDGTVAQNRGTYGSHEFMGISVEFILSAIGYAVGIGNVWRFPYKTANNGGGAFLIPYALMLLFCGIPVFFLELAMGQYSAKGPLTVWSCSPIFKGIGWGVVCVSGLVCFYYNVVIAWSIRFLYASFSSVLPWTRCDAEWNNQTGNLLCTTGMDFSAGNDVVDAEQFKTMLTPAAEFWYFGVLRQHQSEGLEDIGSPLLDLTIE